MSFDEIYFGESGVNTFVMKTERIKEMLGRGDVEGGFKLGIGPNVVLATKGPPMDVMDPFFGRSRG